MSTTKLFDNSMTHFNSLHILPSLPRLCNINRLNSAWFQNSNLLYNSEKSFFSLLLFCEHVWTHLLGDVSDTVGKKYWKLLFLYRVHQLTAHGVLSHWSTCKRNVGGVHQPIVLWDRNWACCCWLYWWRWCWWLFLVFGGRGDAEEENWEAENCGHKESPSR